MLAQDSGSWSLAIGMMVGVGVVLVYAGWVLLWVAKRTASGEMGRNAFAGIRTKATCSSDEAWLVAHQAGESLTRWGGWALILTSVLAVPPALILGGGDQDRAVGIWGVAVLIGTLVTLALVSLGGWKGHQAAKQLETTDGRGPQAGQAGR